METQKGKPRTKDLRREKPKDCQMEISKGIEKVTSSETRTGKPRRTD